MKNNSHFWHKDRLALKGGSAVIDDIFMPFVCLLAKPNAAFKWIDAISAFPVPQVVQKHKLGKAGK